MRKLSILCCCVLSFLLVATAAWAAPAQTIGGKWLAEGAGFAEKGILRVELTADGYINIHSTISGDVETITGYDVSATLHATKAEFNAWSYSDTEQLAAPIPITNFNPTVSDPLTLPSFTVDGLTYTIALTSTTSGTVKLRGNVDIDGFGNCEVNADCALWKEGTPKPDIPDTGSGCNAGTAGVLAILLVPAMLIGRRRIG